MQKITLIVAKSKNNCIGQNNQLPWHLPEDLKFFKEYTLNKPILMGRLTWESLPKKPLPYRDNIVISSQNNYNNIAGVKIFRDIELAINSYKFFEEICIIGGQSIYEQTISLATDLRVTQIDKVIYGDKFFPIIDMIKWICVDSKLFISDGGLSCRFNHFIRKIK